MTIKELKEKLSSFDDNLNVSILVHTNGDDFMELPLGDIHDKLMGTGESDDTLMVAIEVNVADYV